MAINLFALRGCPHCHQPQLPGHISPPGARLQRSSAAASPGAELLWHLGRGKRNYFLEVAAVGEMPGEKLPPGVCQRRRKPIVKRGIRERSLSPKMLGHPIPT